MFSDDDLTLDCATCLAANTTACSECIVSHLLANDDGPIGLEPVPIAVPIRPLTHDHGRARERRRAERRRALERQTVDDVVGCFVRAGLVDDPPTFVTAEEFGADRHRASV